MAFFCDSTPVSQNDNPAFQTLLEDCIEIMSQIKQNGFEHQKKLNCIKETQQKRSKQPRFQQKMTNLTKKNKK